MNRDVMYHVYMIEMNGIEMKVIEIDGIALDKVDRVEFTILTVLLF